MTLHFPLKNGVALHLQLIVCSTMIMADHCLSFIISFIGSLDTIYQLCSLYHLRIPRLILGFLAPSNSYYHFQVP